MTSSPLISPRRLLLQLWETFYSSSMFFHTVTWSSSLDICQFQLLCQQSPMSCLAGVEHGPLFQREVGLVNMQSYCTSYFAFWCVRFVVCHIQYPCASTSCWTRNCGWVCCSLASDQTTSLLVIDRQRVVCFATLEVRCKIHQYLSCHLMWFY